MPLKLSHGLENYCQNVLKVGMYLEAVVNVVKEGCDVKLRCDSGSLLNPVR